MQIGSTISAVSSKQLRLEISVFYKQPHHTSKVSPIPLHIFHARILDQDCCYWFSNVLLGLNS